jgi:hypothetical protein
MSAMYYVRMIGKYLTPRQQLAAMFIGVAVAALVFALARG